MSEAPKKLGPFASLCNSVEKIALRFLDNVAFNGERLSKIENRLALLDGGPDAKMDTFHRSSSRTPIL